MASKTGLSVAGGKTIIQMIESALDEAILTARETEGFDDYTAGTYEGYHNGLAKALALLRNPYQDKQDETLDAIYADALARVDEEV
jgi:hypothetical protein